MKKYRCTSCGNLFDKEIKALVCCPNVEEVEYDEMTDMACAFFNEQMYKGRFQIVGERLLGSYVIINKGGKEKRVDVSIDNNFGAENLRFMKTLKADSLLSYLQLIKEYLEYEVEYSNPEGK